MAVFAYEAIQKDASPVAGTVTAGTARQARDALRKQGLTVTVVQELPGHNGGHGSFLERRRGRRAQGAVVAFIRELATLLEAGIPLHSALETLAAQHRRGFQAVVQHLADRVAAGVSLAEALNEQAAYFDELCVSIVRVGESTGSLDAALKRLAEFKEQGHRLRSRLANALLYPAVVCGVGLIVMVFLMTSVVPNLLGTLSQIHKELPAITRVVKGASDLLIHWWWAIILVLGLLVLAVRAVLRSERGRSLADRLILRIPVIGDLATKENTARIAVVLAALLRSGLQFVEAVRITRRTIRNRVFQQALAEYEAAVSAGRDVAATLAATGVFAPLVVQMLAVGQHAGQLEEMLEQLAEAYEQEVATATQRLTALLEPVLIVLLALMVGTIAFATILPIMEASNVL